MVLRMSLHRMQFLFFALLIVVAVLCLFLEFFYMPDISPLPRATLQRILITADDSDGRRLGNSLFCFASMLGIAAHHNMTPIMPTSSRLASIFDLKVSLTPNLKNSLGSHNVHEEYGRRGSAYDFSTQNLPLKNTRLLGYYQSWKYFDHMADTVRKNLKFKKTILSQAEDFFHIHPRPSPEYTLVGIHVRRGDMLQEYYKRYGYVVPEADYFEKAKEYFRKKFPRVQFVVCSDDITWAEENIQGDDVIFSKGYSDAVDMAILSLCNHTIVSVGSFGWWAAYLANGMTVYYKDWPKEYSMLEYNVDKKDYFPPYWIPL